MYVPGRYGTLRSLCLCLCLWVLDPRLLSHIDTLLFFESRKGGIIKVDGRLVGYTFARAYARACVCVCPWITTKT